VTGVATGRQGRLGKVGQNEQNLSTHTFADQNVHRLENKSTKYHAKQLEPYYLTEILSWELYNIYTYQLFCDLVDIAGLFDLRLIPSRSGQALRN